jgi:type II secretory pathway component GspD/PulD (secretin)
VFFDRFGKQTSSTHPGLSHPHSATDIGSVTPRHNNNKENPKVRRRRLIVLGLAANFTMPMSLLAQTAQLLESKQGDASDSKAAPAKSNLNTVALTPVKTPVSSTGSTDVADDVRALYVKGRAEFRSGDFVAARRDLLAAHEAGYKAGLFEESPVSMLVKMEPLVPAVVKVAVDANTAATSIVQTRASSHVILAMADAPADATTQPATAPAETPAPASAPAADNTTPPAATAPAVATPVPVPVPVVTPTATEAPDLHAAAETALTQAANYERIKQQQQVYTAQQLVEKARTEEAANQMHQAFEDYTSATKLDPNNQQAAAGAADLAVKIGMQPAPIPETMRLKNTIPERIDAIYYKFNSSLDKASQATTAGDFAAAQRAIDDAKIARNTDPTIFTQQQLNEMDQKLANTQDALERTRLQKAEKDQQTAAAAAAKSEAERAHQAELDRQRTVTALIQDARTFIDQSKYVEALGVIEHIQALDPTNEYAGNVRQFIEDKAILQQQRQYMETKDRELEKQLNAADEELIPYSDIIRYPDKWPEISQMRDDEVKAEQGLDTTDAALQAQLDRRLPELHFNANGFADVVDFLRDVTGANIYVDWPALERASISRDAPVTARLRDIKFSKALELIFKSVEGEDDDRKLGYTLDEGVITISTRKELNKNVVTRRYDINDLLFVAPDYNDAPSLSLQNNNNNQGGGGQGGQGGGGGGQQNQLFTNVNQTNTSQTDQNATRGARIDEIKKYIVDNVAPTTWKDNGGDVGSISSSPLRAVLLVTQTPENQKAITSILDSLRASQALQVSIETRFLIVQRNYLEDIGVNANFEFNPLQNPADPTSGVWSSKFSPIPVTHTAVTDNSTFRDANGNIVPSTATGASRTLDWQSNVGNASVPGSIASNPGDYPNPIVIQGSYMDNFTVNFLIRAVEANQKTTSLTAPRLTLFSGQRAELIVETQQAYVSDLTPVVAPGVGLFDPDISTTTAVGVVLSVLATVSPDRKYVYLDLQPQLARLRALVPFTISAVIAPVATIGGVVTGTSQIVQGTLQLPTIDTTIVKTSCSCPDGATLLLGGQTLAGETEREQGVPVLSKIPFLKRLFTNRASSSDEQILLILVKPTILIQHELEQKQFPLLSTKLND